MDTTLKQQATELLEKKNILNILSEMGSVEVVGSYAFDLMTWQDIDILVTNNNLDKAAIYAIGAKFLPLNPKAMKFEDRILDPSIHVPAGFYWGIVTEDGWKLDIWFIDEEVSLEHKAAREELFANLTPERRELIMKLKSNSLYRKKYVSMDVYKKVLQEGVTTEAEFLQPYV